MAARTTIAAGNPITNYATVLDGGTALHTGDTLTITHALVLEVEQTLTCAGVSFGAGGSLTSTISVAVTEISAYNTLATARDTAGRLGLTKVVAASDAVLQAAMELAAIDIDSAMRYQGRKWDLAQEREFPRWKEGVGNQLCAAPYGAFGQLIPDPLYSTGVWDWDAGTDTAIVPAAVKMAECLQAESILAADRSERLQAIADGVASQGVGSLNESYRADARPQALCARAAAMMSKYRIRSGAIL